MFSLFRKGELRHDEFDLRYKFHVIENFILYKFYLRKIIEQQPNRNL